MNESIEFSDTVLHASRTDLLPSDDSSRLVLNHECAPVVAAETPSTVKRQPFLTSFISFFSFLRLGYAPFR